MIAENPILALLAGAAAGGFINGLAGFGIALMALAIWLQVMPSQQAVPIVAVLAVVTGFQGLWLVRRDVVRRPGRAMRFLLPALIGVPVGTALLLAVSETTIRLVIAAIMLAYGGFFTLGRSVPRIHGPTPVIDTLVGLAGGVMGGAAGLSGVLPTMWCALRPWPRNETRAVLQVFNQVILTASAILFAWRGLYTPQVLLMAAISLPVAVIAAQAGIVIFRRLSDDLFRRLLIWTLFGAGILIALREMF